MNKNKIITCIIAASFLFLALLNGLPYGFFTLLRIVVTITAFYLVWLSYEEDVFNYQSFIYLGIGILFNPIIPVYLSLSRSLGMD